MFNKKNILAFIGARAGSKGLKNKNLADLGGKSLIRWTIEAAKGSQYIDRTIVSTDSEAIAAIARQGGADVPFLRPAQLAQDESLIEHAIEHCVNWLKENEHCQYDYIVLLQPTSPLRSAKEIDQAIEHYFRHKKTEKDHLISVTRAPQKTAWLMRTNDAGYIEFCFDEALTKRQRQGLDTYYLPNGAIYLGSSEIMCHLQDHNKHILPFIMDEKSSVDIDTSGDLAIALQYLEEKKCQKSVY
ncbi:MAG TPA: acylneuraminate cytidylyltransferase family protein [Candidatus Omnitrophota bacterium]|nr:acylneuraminate cytidylyltransferase family protein [Candidatus Omnitrophota bacterium]